MRQMGQRYEVLRSDPRPHGVLLLLVAVYEMESAEILDAFWQRGDVLGQEVLVPTSLPPVEQLEPLRRRSRT